MKFSGLHKQRLSVEKGGMRQNARRLAADEEKCEREDITLEKREGFFERFFGISQSGSNMRTEVLAGITTFITVAYILILNPQILADPFVIGGDMDMASKISNSIIRDLIRHNVTFQRDENGELAFTREGAHSQPRILFYEDVTGKQITQTLLGEALTRENIEICEYMTMVDLISRDNICGGIIVMDEQNNVYPIRSPHVVLACGGLGGLYKNSTNFPHIAGDGLGIAMKHQVRLEHLDYIQIHPTTLYSRKPGRRFLISESVRGEGALLYDKNGQRFTEELQPRDLLSQAIFAQMEKDDTEFVWEDMRPLGEDTILKHFPNIFKRCMEEGFDPRKEPIPVVPAQHYFMGGIKVDLGSRTSMKGLYACGETSCNGVHGKNRLASNSLLESLVFARRAADDIVFGDKPEKCPVNTIDTNIYEDRNVILDGYHKMVWNEIERMKRA